MISRSAPGPVAVSTKLKTLSPKWISKPTNPLIEVASLSLNCGSFGGIADCAGIVTAAGCMVTWG